MLLTSGVNRLSTNALSGQNTRTGEGLSSLLEVSNTGTQTNSLLLSFAQSNYADAVEVSNNAENTRSGFQYQSDIVAGQQKANITEQDRLTKDIQNIFALQNAKTVNTGNKEIDDTLASSNSSTIPITANGTPTISFGSITNLNIVSNLEKTVQVISTETKPTETKSTTTASETTTSDKPAETVASDKPAETTASVKPAETQKPVEPAPSVSYSHVSVKMDDSALKIMADALGKSKDNNEKAIIPDSSNSDSATTTIPLSDNTTLVAKSIELKEKVEEGSKLEDKADAAQTNLEDSTEKADSAKGQVAESQEEVASTQNKTNNSDASTSSNPFSNPFNRKGDLA